MGDGGAALAAAPAIDERLPAARAILESVLQVPRNVGADVRGANLLRLERGHLLVDGADLRALRIIERRAIDRAGNMIFRKRVFGAHIDDLVKLGKLCYGCKRRAS